MLYSNATLNWQFYANGKHPRLGCTKHRNGTALKQWWLDLGLEHYFNAKVLGSGYLPNIPQHLLIYFYNKSNFCHVLFNIQKQNMNLNVALNVASMWSHINENMVYWIDNQTPRSYNQNNAFDLWAQTLF